jgi:predicted ribosome quality control (RQC) complex YloA/Tae2 family protein
VPPDSQKRPVEHQREAVEKKIESLQKSLRKVEDEIEKKAHSPWRRFGQWLVENQSMNVPPEFLALVDRRRKLAWNVEEAFRKAKEAERKLEGTRARAIELKVQIADLEKRLSQGDWLSVEKKKTSPKGDRPDARTLRLSETLHVVAGKSARDNLDLLRKAHAWDLWLHVKDQPSAHAIVFRPKGAKLSDEQLRQASQWLIKMSLGSKYKAHVGEKFEILAAECRFVTPIKGDRLGRVTYRNEKVFILKFEGERPPSP